MARRRSSGNQWIWRRSARASTRYCRPSRGAEATRPRRRELLRATNLRARDSVFLVHEHEPGLEVLELALLVVAVADHDHVIAGGAVSRRGAVELKRSAPALALDDVRLESRARVDVHH